ncbi:MAG: hypothetical protein NT091_03205, partial [Candidatus Falkowbacteria bacterium]|nr:hypothetical protein [Candidatus Falkowbacteria bacterium]
ENYNRYDEEIKEVVAHWNCEFFKDIDPPEEPLDPNLVKAMIWQESRMGYTKGAEINLMQVGKIGDDSLKTLTGELPEYWIYTGEEILLEYKEAKVETPSDSIYWGVRWLYHKAQGITKNDRKKYWLTWKEALAKYGPGKQEYTENVWSIYQSGLDKREKIPLKLWGIIFLAISFAFLSYFPRSFNPQRSEVVEKNIIAQAQERIFFDTEIIPCPNNSQLFISILEREKDW